MGDKIYVPYQEAESEFVEKRSRFIGHIWPVDGEDQAQELIRRVQEAVYRAHGVRLEPEVRFVGE